MQKWVMLELRVMECEYLFHMPLTNKANDILDQQGRKQCDTLDKVEGAGCSTTSIGPWTVEATPLYIVYVGKPAPGE